jgi:hypothetical protein
MNPSDHLSDAISAASLVLAVLVALYTLWLGDVNAALALVPKADSDDRDPQRAQVKRAILTKAAPLSGATIAAFLILAPRTLAILCEVYWHHADWGFDDVKALFALTVALLALLMIVSVVQLVALKGKRKNLG